MIPSWQRRRTGDGSSRRREDTSFARSFIKWQVVPIGELASLASAFPGTGIVLEHRGEARRNRYLYRQANETFSLSMQAICRNRRR